MARGVALVGRFVLRRLDDRIRFVFGGSLLARGNQFGPQDANVSRCVDRQLDDFPLNVNHRDGVVLADLNLLHQFS